MDVTHYRGRDYLSLIDCGPSRFTVWRQLRRADAAEITNHLEDLFLERGTPTEILTDNATAFRGLQVAALAARWKIAMRFRAVHEPGGNGIVERCHRSVKVIAARRECTISEAVHLYNVSPRDGEREETVSAAGVYTYAVRDCIRPPQTDGEETGAMRAPAVSRGARPRVGDRVWMRQPGTRCTELSRRGTVTGVTSPQVLEVDGVPWHVRDLRPRRDGDGSPDGDNSSGDESDADDQAPLWTAAVDQCHTETEDPPPAAGPDGDTEDGRAEVSENPPPPCAEASVCGSPLDPGATVKSNV